MCSKCDYTIHRASHHFGWDHDFEPALTVGAGLDDRVSVSRFLGRPASTPSARSPMSPTLDFGKVNPVTGPIYRRRRRARRRAEGDDRAVQTFRLRLDRQHSGLRPARRPVRASRRCNIWKYDAASMTPALYGPGRPRAAETLRRHDRHTRRPNPACTRWCRRGVSAAISTSATWPPAPRSICRSRSRARCFRSATPTPPRATARSAAPRSRARMDVELTTRARQGCAAEDAALHHAGAGDPPSRRKPAMR